MQQFNFKELQASCGLTFREVQYKMSLVYVRNRIFLRFQSLSEITLNLRRPGISWAFAGRSIHEETFPAFCRPGRGRCRKNGWLSKDISIHFIPGLKKELQKKLLWQEGFKKPGKECQDRKDTGSVNPERVIVERALANETSKKAVVFYLNFRVTFLNLILEAINLKFNLILFFWELCFPMAEIYWLFHLESHSMNVTLLSRVFSGFSTRNAYAKVLIREV